MSALDRLARLWMSGMLAALPGGIAAALLVWLLTRLLRRWLSPAVRCWLWWLVCARLALVGLGGPTLSFSLPATPLAPKIAALDTPLRSLAASVAPATELSASAASHASLSVWGGVGLLYALGVLVGLGLLLRQGGELRRLLRAARPLDDAPLAGALRQEAMRFRLAQAPRLAESDAITSPLVAGWFPPTLLLPLGFLESVDDDEARMALAHELAHLRRGDLYLALAPNLARLLLFPLVPLWLPVCRAWASAREAACDAEALAVTGGSPARYSRLLLKLVSADARPSPLAALGATSAFHGLQERVHAVLNPGRASRVVAVLALGLAGVALLPWTLAGGLPSDVDKLAPLRRLALQNDPADIRDVPVREARIGGDPKRRYLLHGGMGTPPPGGWKLLAVLPGGDGGENFQFFVRRLLKFGLGESYVVVQPIAPTWGVGQAAQLVWPTRTDPWPSARFTTEEFVESAIRDVGARLPLDSQNVFVLGWASGGPAALASALGGTPSVKGALIQSSVYRFESLPDPALARGKRLYLLHPAHAPVAPQEMAVGARLLLEPHAAALRLAYYDGGYGWSGDVYGQLRAGVAFLERGK